MLSCPHFFHNLSIFFVGCLLPEAEAALAGIPPREGEDFTPKVEERKGKKPVEVGFFFFSGHLPVRFVSQR